MLWSIFNNQDVEDIAAPPEMPMSSEAAWFHDEVLRLIVAMCCSGQKLIMIELGSFRMWNLLRQKSQALQ